MERCTVIGSEDTSKHRTNHGRCRPEHFLRPDTSDLVDIGCSRGSERRSASSTAAPFVSPPDRPQYLYLIVDSPNRKDNLAFTNHCFTSLPYQLIGFHSHNVRRSKKKRAQWRGQRQDNHRGFHNSTKGRCALQSDRHPAYSRRTPPSQRRSQLLRDRQQRELGLPTVVVEATPAATILRKQHFSNRKPDPLTTTTSRVPSA